MSIDNTTIQGWKAIIEQNTQSNPKLALDYCNKILEYAQEAKLGYLFHYGYYYMAEAYYSMKNVGEVLKNLSLSETYKDHCEKDNKMLISKMYNLCAISSMTIGNSPYALDYYIKSLECSRENEIPYYECMSLINIGTLYYNYGEYNAAKKYFEEAMTCLKMNELIQGNEFFSSNLKICLGKCALRDGDIELAKLYKSQIIPEVRENPTCQMFECMLAHASGDYEERDTIIQYIEDVTNDDLNIMDFFEDYYEICSFFLDVNLDQVFLRIVRCLELLVTKANITNLSRKVSELKIRYYLSKGDGASYLNETGRFYEKTSQMSDSNKYMVIGMMNVRMELEEEKHKSDLIRKENEKLTKKSETDALTGLHNRFRLNHYAGEIFNRSVVNNNFFAIEILDIDYFKQFNDNYGHQEGDKAIKMIADELKKIAEIEGVSVYRYGGDEFVVIYEGMTETMVRSVAESLKKGITDIHMEHKYSKAADYVTISQGICFEIPRDGENVWDYLHMADESLYEVKKYSRNSITVTRYTDGGF